MPTLFFVYTMKMQTASISCYPQKGGSFLLRVAINALIKVALVGLICGC